MPVLQPAEAWHRTGRYEIDELFKLKDRKGADMVLAMTHEECVTTHVAQVVRSYRDLPFSLYHFQVKERDEPRPRAGVLRTREFIMKDAYTFDRDEAGLHAHYDAYAGAYDRIFERTGLRWYSVESDVGMMGGSGAHEYMAPCRAGENEVALAPGYAANVEVATADPQPVDLPEPLSAPEAVHTPAATTVDDVTRRLGVPAGALLKAFPVDRRRQLRAGRRPRARARPRARRSSRQRDQAHERARRAVAARARGGDRRQDRPARLHRSGRRQRADPARRGGRRRRLRRRRQRARPPPARCRARPRLRLRARRRAQGRGRRHGRRPDDHDRARHRGRQHLPARHALLRSRSARPTSTSRARSSRSSWAPTGSGRRGSSRPPSSSSPTRRASPGRARSRRGTSRSSRSASPAATSWPPPKGLYRELRTAGLEVLLDDRDLGPGSKFADAELLGCPLRLTVGRRSLQEGRAEAQIRRGLEDVEGGIPLEGAAEAVVELWRTLP